LRDPNERDCQQHLAARSAAAFLINKHLFATKLKEPPAEPSLERERKTPNDDGGESRCHVSLAKDNGLLRLELASHSMLAPFGMDPVF